MGAGSSLPFPEEEYDDVTTRTYPRVEVGRSVELMCGRTLGYEVYGVQDPTEATAHMIFVPGMPGSRLFFMPEHDEYCRAAGIRVLVFDRPGVGLSSHHPERTYTTWAADVREALEVLGLPIDRYLVVGYSSGGPYALALASLLPTYVSAAAVISSLGPKEAPGAATAGVTGSNKLAWHMARLSSGLAGAMVNSTHTTARRKPLAIVESLLSDTPASELEWLRSQLGVQKLFLESALEVANSPHGAASEAREYELVRGEWDFDLGAIDVHVDVWVGDEDHPAMLTMAEYIASAVQNSNLICGSGKGHMYFFECFPQVVDGLVTRLEAVAKATTPDAPTVEATTPLPVAVSEQPVA